VFLQLNTEQRCLWACLLHSTAISLVSGCVFVIFQWSIHYCRQGRTLADWTDCFQSGPAPKGARRYAYKLTLSIESVCVVPARGPTVFLGVGPVAIENKNELRRLLTPSIIIIRSLTMVIVFLQRVAWVFFYSGRLQRK